MDHTSKRAVEILVENVLKKINDLSILNDDVSESDYTFSLGGGVLSEERVELYAHCNEFDDVRSSVDFIVKKDKKKTVEECLAKLVDIFDCYRIPTNLVHNRPSLYGDNSFLNLPISFSYTESRGGWSRETRRLGTVAELLDIWDIDDTSDHSEMAQVLRLLRNYMRANVEPIKTKPMELDEALEVIAEGLEDLAGVDNGREELKDIINLLNSDL